MAAASEVTFDVLLGGKVTPQLLKSFKDLEELMKKQGATAKTINAVMGRAYKQTFDGVASDAKKSSESVEHSWKHAMTEMVEKTREMRHKVSEQFDKLRESYNKLAETVKKPLEWIGLTGVLSAAGGALGGAELIKKGIEVHRARETQAATLRAALAGRGAGAEAPEWEEAAEQIARQARVGHDEAMKMMTKLAVSGKFRTAGQAQQMAMALVGLGGGTAEGAEQARAAYGKVSMMMLAGKVRPTAIGAVAGGSGLGGALLKQLSADTGVPVTELAKQFAPAKVSKKTGEVTGGALAGAKGVEALNKAILELSQSRGIDMIKAKMTGMDGMFYRFAEHWEDFTNKIGQAFEDFIAPIADRVNALLDSINFEQVFEGMIEKAKEWGQLVAAVWDSIANAPVLNQIKSMWDNFWKSLTGGAELYGPYVETWKDNMHHEFGTVMAKHPTKAFFALRDLIANNLGKIIHTIIDAFQWFIDHGKEVWFWITKIAEAFIALKGIEMGLWVAKITKALLWDIPAAFTGMIAKLLALTKGEQAEKAVKTGAEVVAKPLTRGAPLLAAAGPAAAGVAGLGFAWGVSKLGDVVGDAIQKKLFPHLGERQTVRGEEYKRAAAALEEARAHGATATHLKRLQDAVDSAYRHLTDQEKASVKATTAIDSLAASAAAFDAVLKARMAMTMPKPTTMTPAAPVMPAPVGMTLETPRPVMPAPSAMTLETPRPVMPTPPAMTLEEPAKAVMQLTQQHQQAAKETQKSTTKIEALTSATEQSINALLGKSPGFIPGVKSVTDELYKFAPVIAQATAQFTSFTGFGGFGGGGFGGGGLAGGALGGFGGGGFGGGGGGGVGTSGGGFTGTSGGIYYTEYGPRIDPPGSKDFDSNSYHRIGAWPGKTGPLQPGDVALGHGAEAFYHVSPGQTFTDTRGNTVRFADRSGSKNPMNEDVFRLAMGAIVRKPTRALVGESGPEAVVPLAGAGAAAAGLGGVTINVNVAGNAHDPEGIASAVERVIREHWRRQAVV